MPRALLATSLAVLPFPLVAAKKEGPADLNLTDLDGRKTHLKDYRGKIVVNFWATKCEPCNEMPMLTGCILHAAVGMMDQPGPR
jgi:thiol-disulfide isomerase/thioredoxin